MDNPSIPSLKERLEAIMAALNLNTRSFALNMGQPYSKVYDIIREKTMTMSPSLRQSIRDTYHVTDAFLLTGIGQMFEAQSTPDLDAMTEAFKRVVQALNEENHQLKDQIAALQKKLDEISKK